MVPRGLAVQVLTAVLSDGASLDQSLERISIQHRLDAQSRAWLVDVTAGVLRWKSRLELAVDSTALKKKPSGWLRKMMLVGAYQLIVQERVAPAIAVSESVSEVKKKEGEAPAKFVNASLRKISESAKQWKELPFREKASLDEQSAWASLQPWFWKKIKDQHGADWAREFAQATLLRPELWLRVIPGGEISADGSSGSVPGAYMSVEGGAVTAKAGFSEGRFFVQDISSQFLVHEISMAVRAAAKAAGAEAVEKSSGKERLTALDLCAAPGGKSLGLAWNGFEVISTDGDSSRLELIRQNIERLKPEIDRMGGSVRIISREDARTVPFQDLVWIDAPCTGSGIVRRHPDVRWLRREKDLPVLRDQQSILVKEGWERVRPGGFLAYSVCSVFKEEGPDLIRKCGLDAHAQQTWLLSPQEKPYGDGFWAALLRKPL
jgi:16S rRNA (cytosine967-C5)-methyltransferase